MTPVCYIRYDIRSGIGYDIRILFQVWYQVGYRVRHLLVLPSPSTFMLIIWMSPLSMEVCRRFRMSWSTSSALNAGFFSKSLIRSLITLALNECFEENALRIYSMPVIIPDASWSKGGTNRSCTKYLVWHQAGYRIWYQRPISGMMSGMILYTIWTYGV